MLGGRGTRRHVPPAGGRLASVERDALEARARGFLAALDRLDLAGALAFFAPDAVFTIQTAHQEFSGTDQIEGLWRHVLGAHAAMRHAVTNVVVDERDGQVATEQSFRGELRMGAVEERRSVYVFELDERGACTRAIVWIDGVTPADPS